MAWIRASAVATSVAPSTDGRVHAETVPLCALLK